MATSNAAIDCTEFQVGDIRAFKSAGTTGPLGTAEIVAKCITVEKKQRTWDLFIWGVWIGTALEQFEGDLIVWRMQP